jgi:hypothetical protein
MSKSKSLASDVAPRQGEGFTIETKAVHTLHSDGVSSLTLGIRMDSAPVPDRRYVADIYAVHPTPGGYRFMFAQEKLGGKELRSLVLVQMSLNATAQLFSSLIDMKTPSIGELGALFGSVSEGPANISQEPEQTVSMKANVATVAVSNGDTAMDFYQISPFAFHAANRGGKIQMNAVVRIELRTGQLEGLVKELGSFNMPTPAEGGSI